MKIFTLICSSIMLSAAALAQTPFSFTNSNSKFDSPTFRSGNAISVVDMDGDGMDDIARLNNANDLYYTIQRTGQTFNNIHAVSTGSSNTWSMIAGDVNNDGIRDVAVGYNGSGKLITPNSTLTAFPMATLPNSNIFFQNMNFADVDNNGWIDIFGCNDVGTSLFWGNSGTGTFPATTNFFSTNNPGASDNSGNYGSIWSDIDNDGDVDFYIAHCRQSTGTSDGRRLDQLFINNGAGNYILDTTGARGLRNLQQTWTASFDDIDNDGDLDCVLTETDAPSKLLLNDGNGYFTDITTGSGFVTDVTPYQSKMEDLDNDGYIDIIISGDDARIYHNNGNNTFTRIDGLFNNNNMLSFATGDLNHDGKIDLYSSYGGVYNSPSGSTDDVLWLNSVENGNHFITFNLQGTISNRDALGARVEVYGAWGKQIREIRAGESYGTTNSFMCHFGLGTATMVDSVIVRWPKGLVTRLYNRPADQFISV
ncbi:MAG TPA: CRTAC1 family protein, partial [Chitinophagales bacterium]|nr:CRTAC1 family protein [Chitinophagales bacterium]